MLFAAIGAFVIPVGIWGGYKYFRKQYYLQERSRLQSEYQAHIFESSRLMTGLPYRIYFPKGYRESRRYPLVLVLHRMTLQGNDNRRQLDGGAVWLASSHLQEKHPAMIVVPQCPTGKTWINKPMAGPPYRNHNMDLFAESTLEKVILELLWRSWNRVDGLSGRECDKLVISSASTAIFS